MIPIYIPSRSRAAEIHKGTLAELQNQANPYIVVPKGQVREYTDRIHPGNHQAAVLACPARGIANTRKWIGEHANANGYDKFLMLDDDLGFLIRRSPKTWRLRGTTEKEVRTMLSVVEQRLDHYACVGISPREGQNRLEASKIEDVYENTRIIRALAFRTEEFLGCKHGRLQVMEDFDVLLQLLRQGHPNCQLTYFAQGQGSTQAPGGCSDYRTHESHEKSARKLADMHPNFVGLRQKKNKSGGEFGHRTEVTIQWKRAFASSQKGNEDEADEPAPTSDSA